MSTTWMVALKVAIVSDAAAQLIFPPASMFDPPRVMVILGVLVVPPVCRQKVVTRSISPAVSPEEKVTVARAEDTVDVVVVPAPQVAVPEYVLDAGAIAKSVPAELRM